MLVVQGDADQVLPRGFVDTFVKALCTAGDPIDYRVYPGADHMSVIPASNGDVMNWIADRFDGQPFVSSC